MQVEALSGDKAGSQVQDRRASTKNSGSEVQVEASSGEKSGSQLQDWTTSTKNTGSEVQVEAPSGESMLIKAANGEVNMPSMHYGYNAMRKTPTVLLEISDPSIESITVLAISTKVVSCKERLSTPMNVIYINNRLVNFFYRFRLRVVPIWVKPRQNLERNQGVKCKMGRHLQRTLGMKCKLRRHLEII